VLVSKWSSPSDSPNVTHVGSEGVGSDNRAPRRAHLRRTCWERWVRLAKTDVAPTPGAGGWAATCVGVFPRAGICAGASVSAPHALVCAVACALLARGPDRAGEREGPSPGRWSTRWLGGVPGRRGLGFQTWHYNPHRQHSHDHGRSSAHGAPRFMGGRNTAGI